MTVSKVRKISTSRIHFTGHFAVPGRQGPLVQRRGKEQMIQHPEPFLPSMYCCADANYRDVEETSWNGCRQVLENLTLAWHPGPTTLEAVDPFLLSNRTDASKDANPFARLPLHCGCQGNHSCFTASAWAVLPHTRKEGMITPTVPGTLRKLTVRFACCRLQ